jgi:hypothetical protein
MYTICSYIVNKRGKTEHLILSYLILHFLAHFLYIAILKGTYNEKMSPVLSIIGKCRHYPGVDSRERELLPRTRNRERSSLSRTRYWQMDWNSLKLCLFLECKIYLNNTWRVLPWWWEQCMSRAVFCAQIRKTESKYEIYNLRGFNIIYNSDPQNLSPCPVSSIICAKCPFKSTVLQDCLAT